MAKQKLVLTANPTFKAIVGIPVPGQENNSPVEFVFKHRMKSDLQEWRDAMLEEMKVSGVSADHVMSMASGWDLEEAFSAENVQLLLETYPGSGLAIYVKYNNELQDAKLGNSVR